MIICPLNIYSTLGSPFSSLDLDQSGHVIPASVGGVSVSSCMVPTSDTEEKAFSFLCKPMSRIRGGSAVRPFTRAQGANTELEPKGKV